MKKLAALMTLATLILLGTAPGFAQSSEEMDALRRENDALREALSLRKEIEALKDGQRAVQKDLEEIKTLLRSRPAAAAAQPTVLQNVVFNIDGEPSKGEKTAKLALIEFTDYQ